MSEFLDLGERIRFEGYVKRKPAEDFRVTVDGFTVQDLSLEEMLEVLIRFREADVQTVDQGNDKYIIRCWWD